MFFLFANYHTHTYRCHHAIGSDEEYILSAINNGIKILGFSDHAPFVFPDGTESGYRIESSEAESYFDNIKVLREKYKDKIEIHIGFEMEYYPRYFNEMLKYVEDLGAEYLILGQHFIGNEYPNGKYVGLDTHSDADLKEFVDCVIAGIKSKKFLYVAHPDVFKFDTKSDVYKTEMKRLCRASKRYGVPLEINFLGIRDNRYYPNDDFWKIAGEVGVNAVFGVDAHTPQSFEIGSALSVAESIAQKNNIKVVESLNIKK